MNEELKTKCHGVKTTLKMTYGNYGIEPLPELLEVNIQRVCLKCQEPCEVEKKRSMRRHK